MVDYSIEYAHIYSDNVFNTEQRQGIKELKKITAKFKKEKKSFSTIILVDEYNPSVDKLVINKFLEHLIQLNAQPDFLSFESRLIFGKNWLLEQMSPELKEKYLQYIQKNNKIPCSLLITIWYLKRLGLINNNQIIIEKIKETSRSFEAKKIINILPKRFEKVEKEAIEIIKLTKFANYAKNIEYIFF